MSEEYWDYLVVGGNFHGQVFNGPARQSTLDVPLKEKRLAKTYGASLLRLCGNVPFDQI